MTLLMTLPAWASELSSGSRHVLEYTFFKMGGLAITPLFLAKALLYVLLLTALSKVVQLLVLGRLFKHLHIAEAQKFALGRFLTYTLFALGLFVGMQTLGVDLSSLVVFGGALGVGVGLGLQNIVSNFVAGLVLLAEQPIRIGDRVEMKSTQGDVVRIAARSTWIRTNDNVVIIVPNSEFINNAVTNWTANDPIVRLHLPVGVSYQSDVEQVRRILLAAASAHADVLTDPRPGVLLTGYGDNSVNFELLVWTSTRAHAPGLLKSDLYFALFKAFAEGGVELPFPQRDLHIRSSDIALPFHPESGPDRSAGKSDSAA